MVKFSLTIGGLSSYSLLILLVSYLKYSQLFSKMDLGHWLIEFLELFGNNFDFKTSYIDVNLDR